MLNELFEQPLKSKEGYKITRAILKVITDALKRGEDVEIPGFGIFKHHITAKRKLPIVIHTTGDCNTATRVVKEVGNKHIIIFEPSIQLMAMLNKKTPNYKENRAMQIWWKE